VGCGCACTSDGAEPLAGRVQQHPDAQAASVASHCASPSAAWGKPQRPGRGGDRRTPPAQPQPGDPDLAEVAGGGARVAGEGGSELLGHSQIGITFNLYSHVTVAAVAQE
jgi:hypothetical protein